MQDSEVSRTIGVLTGIFGVGTKTALKWYHQGIRTLDDVRQRVRLSAVQEIGLRYYDVVCYACTLPLTVSVSVANHV